LKCAFRTKKGYIPNLPSKVNQDIYILLPYLNLNKNSHFFAVCDGHGDYGH
jgi:serine/threonine protein phosphatase PrpC